MISAQKSERFLYLGLGITEGENIMNWRNFTNFLLRYNLFVKKYFIFQNNKPFIISKLSVTSYFDMRKIYIFLRQ